jgi:hypothetical protein
VDCDICTRPEEALVTHRNAPLTETGRLRLARCIVDDGWPLRRAAERFQVSVSTATRWASRYRCHGEAGMSDRSSQPHHSPRRTPTRTPTRTERRIIKVRVLRRWGPARIASLLGLAASTVHRVLARYRLARLSQLKKLGNIPDGGGHKVHGRATGSRNNTRTAPITNNSTSPRAKLGYSYLHNAVDDHSRLAYVEILPDETRPPPPHFGPAPPPGSPPTASPSSGS